MSYFVGGNVPAPINVTAASNQLVLGSGSTTLTLSAAASTAKTLTLPDITGTVFLVGGGQTVTSGTWNGAVVGALYGGTGVASPTANGILVGNGSSPVTSSVLTNGQLLIGSTGASPVAASLTGTTNQVNVSTGAGSVTLGLPQNIHSGANPSFAGNLLALSVVKTAAFTADATTTYYPCDATSATFAATLPSAASAGSGRTYFFKKTTAANTVTVTADGSDTIDGAATQDLTTVNSSYMLVSDGVSKWYIV